MVSLNADNNTSSTNCQETNFEVVQILIRYSWKLAISKSAFKVLLYQIDQEFGFIRNGKIKDGDKISHVSRAKHLGITKLSVINAINELECRGVIFVDREHRTVNHYHINRDVLTWILNEKLTK